MKPNSKWPCMHIITFIENIEKKYLFYARLQNFMIVPAYHRIEISIKRITSNVEIFFENQNPLRKTFSFRERIV